MSGRLVRAAALAALILPFAAPPAAAQSAEEILETLREKHDARMAGVDDYTVVMEVMGIETVTYYEKAMVDGQPVYNATTTIRGGGPAGKQGSVRTPAVAQADWITDELAARARVVGSESVAGHATRVVEVDDFEGVDLAEAGLVQDGQGFTPKRARFFIDTDSWVLRKMVMNGDMDREGKRTPVEMEVLLDDYREVGGLLYPYSTRMVMTGLMEGATPEEREEARQGLAELEQQMAQMPPQQREMMEKMMGGQLKKLREMVASGRMEVTVQVKELKVNAGPPAS